MKTTNVKGDTLVKPTSESLRAGSSTRKFISPIKETGPVFFGPSTIQSEFSERSPNDGFEQDADMVMRMPVQQKQHKPVKNDRGGNPGLVEEKVPFGKKLIQRQDGESDSPNGSRDIQDIENILRRLPVETPHEVNQTKSVINLFIRILGAGAEGAAGQPTPVALLGAPFNVDTVIHQLQDEQYWDAASTLVGLAGSAATAFSILVNAAIDLGAISGISALAEAGVVAGLVGEIAGPGAIALATLVEVFSILSDTNDNLWKIYYIAEVSGVLTSWVFNDDTISPHSRILLDARSGAFGADLRGAVRTGHQRADEYWNDHFHDNPGRIRQARRLAANDYRTYWRRWGRVLESHLNPDPTGIAVGYINDLINDVNRRRRELRIREQARRREEEFNRRGGVITTPEGFNFVIPPAEQE